ncbi:MAG: hypothetical protein NVSMB13_01900 [Mycobacteriales bacterium]
MPVVPPVVPAVPKNHGACVSEAAHDHDGEEAEGAEHGDTVSKVAQSDCGKTKKPTVKPTVKATHTEEAHEQEHSGSTERHDVSGDHRGSGGRDH